MDVSNPLTVEKIGEYVIAPDSTIMWGIDVYQHKIVGSFVDNSGIPPILQPYYGDYGGLQFFEYNEQIIGIEELEAQNNFTVYPNPTMGKIEVKSNENIEYITLKNVLGESLKQFNTTQLDISNFPVGIYVVEITTDKGSFSQKLLLFK